MLRPTSLVVLGPPNTGKSTLMSSIAEIVDPSRIALITLRPKEHSSFGYVKHGMDGVVITDPHWKPDLGKFKAEGYLRLLKAIDQLYESEDYDAVILDPLTDAFELASHDILKSDKVATPKDLPGKGPLAYYGAMRKKAHQIVSDLNMLTVAPHPKWVLTAIHTQPAQDEGIDRNKETSDSKAKGVRFEGGVLPMVEGSYRYDMAGDFAIKLYTHVEVKARKEPRYVVQVRADLERFAGIGVSPTLPHEYLPNHLPTIFKAIEATNADG